VQNLLGHGYDKLDRVREAVDAYQKAIHSDPRNPSYVFDLGLMALRRRTYDLAEIVLTAGVRAFPENRNLALALGGAYQLRGQMELAQKTYRELLERNPEDSLGYLYLGNSYFEAGRFKDAADAFAKGIELDPKSALLHYQQAVSMIKLGEDSNPRVQELLEKAVALDAKVAPAYYQLAKLAADSRESAKSRRLVQRALLLDPEMSESHFLLARLCRQEGDTRCADEAMKRYETLRARERERIENDRVLGILFTLR
jgi:cytochrome c-type biogenesis protein CcmH/NrfG